MVFDHLNHLMVHFPLMNSWGNEGEDPPVIQFRTCWHWIMRFFHSLPCFVFICCVFSSMLLLSLTICFFLAAPCSACCFISCLCFFLSISCSFFPSFENIACFLEGCFFGSHKKKSGRFLTFSTSPSIAPLRSIEIQ